MNAAVAPGAANVPTAQPWMRYALCRTVDPELFFPQRGGHASAAPAKRICAACLVQHECLAYALDTGEEWGVWGGTSETERRKLRRILDATTTTQ